MTTWKPRGLRAADHTTPSEAASAASPSGITNSFVPFGVPGLNGSEGRRANITSTPPWRGRPARGESKPSEITGARPFERGTGQTQRPAIGSAPAGAGALGGVVRLL